MDSIPSTSISINANKKGNWIGCNQPTTKSCVIVRGREPLVSKLNHCRVIPLRDIVELFLYYQSVFYKIQSECVLFLIDLSSY